MTGTRDGTERFGWLAGAGAILSLAACYGTLGVVAVLSAMGVALAINEQIWAGAIVAFAALAAAGVVHGHRRHGRIPPVALAVIGVGLVAAAMYAGLGGAARVVELLGFAALVGAAVWDWRLKRSGA